MKSLYAIGWFILLYLNIIVIFEVIGIRGLVNMFPEGRRWWHIPAQLASLAVFSTIILFHPF